MHLIHQPGSCEEAGEVKMPGGGSIHDTVIGTGSPELVFAHGLGVSPEVYWTLGPIAEALGVRFRAMWQPNSGPSLSVETAEEWHTFLAEWARQRRLEEAIWVGHSMGGLTAVLMTHHHPDVAGSSLAMASPLTPRYTNISDLETALRLGIVSTDVAVSLGVANVEAWLRGEPHEFYSRVARTIIRGLRPERVLGGDIWSWPVRALRIDLGIRVMRDMPDMPALIRANHARGITQLRLWGQRDQAVLPPTAGELAGPDWIIKGMYHNFPVLSQGHEPIVGALEAVLRGLPFEPPPVFATSPS